MTNHVSTSLGEVVEPNVLVTSLDLKRLLRDVSSKSKKAIEKLVALMESPDDKVALGAAKSLLEFQITVAKEINTDHLQRIIAHVKLKLAGNGGESEESKSKRPLVDFENVRTVE